MNWTELKHAIDVIFPLAFLVLFIIGSFFYYVITDLVKDLKRKWWKRK